MLPAVDGAKRTLPSHEPTTDVVAYYFYLLPKHCQKYDVIWLSALVGSKAIVVASLEAPHAGAAHSRDLQT